MQRTFITIVMIFMIVSVSLGQEPAQARSVRRAGDPVLRVSQGTGEPMPGRPRDAGPGREHTVVEKTEGVRLMSVSERKSRPHEELLVRSTPTS